MEATLQQIREKYFVAGVENDGIVKFRTAITELLKEIKNETRPSGLVPLVENAEGQALVSYVSQVQNQNAVSNGGSFWNRLS